MKPKDILLKWIEAFNNADVEAISALYDDNAINHQVANSPVQGIQAIKEMFQNDFDSTEMMCIVENIFEDGDWAILEWKDQFGLCGCGFFQIINGKIAFQRGYWDKLSFLKLQIAFTADELAEAHSSLLSTLNKCEKVLESEKLPQPQRTLAERRVSALKIALSLIERERK